MSAEGVRLTLASGDTLIDGISSWWCVIHGYSHPKLVKAINKQAKSLSHVMLGGLTHDPAEKLADVLVDLTPEGLNHVFFSDSGSVGMEVALKMALQYWKNRGSHEKTKILALNGAYHGDTTGAMAMCDPIESMHSLFSGNLMENYFIDPPTCGFDPDYDVLEPALDALDEYLFTSGNEIAALVVEPIMQCVAGFKIHPPEYLKEARRLCNMHDVLMICDEVATGFGRTGTYFATNHARITPDIMTLGKGLTGGMMGLAATLATDNVYEAFYDTDPSKAFMHGPTFMGNPLACSVALESIAIFDRENYLNKISTIENLLKKYLLGFKHADIIEIRVLGAMGVIEVRDKACLEGFQEFAASKGIWLRPFDTYLYTMPPYIISEEDLVSILKVMKGWFGSDD